MQGPHAAHMQDQRSRDGSSDLSWVLSSAVAVWNLPKSQGLVLRGMGPRKPFLSCAYSLPYVWIWVDDPHITHVLST